MANYVYGIVSDAAQPPAGTGIAGAAVHTIQAAGAAALVSDLPDDARLEFGREELLVHARVLEEALDHGTVLPMRFGVVLEGSEAVRHDLLDAHAQELQTQLAELDGKVEVRVRAVWEEAPVMREVVAENPDISHAREEIAEQPEEATYFKRINLGELVSDALEQKREHDAQAIMQALAPHAVASALGEVSHERVVLSASFLIDRTSQQQFEQAVEKVAAGQAGRMRVTFTDPLPPHSFVHFSGSG